MTDDGKTHYYGDNCDPPHVPPDKGEHWYMIEELELQKLLDRVHDGEQPAIILAEIFANTEEAG